MSTFIIHGWIERVTRLFLKKNHSFGFHRNYSDVHPRRSLQIYFRLHHSHTFSSNLGMAGNPFPKTWKLSVILEFVTNYQVLESSWCCFLQGVTSHKVVWLSPQSVLKGELISPFSPSSQGTPSTLLVPLGVFCALPPWPASNSLFKSFPLRWRTVQPSSFFRTWLMDSFLPGVPKP